MPSSVSFAPADNTGVVAGVVVFLLLVIVVAVVTLVVAVFLVKRGRSRKEIAESNVGGKTTGINNVMGKVLFITISMWVQCHTVSVYIISEML